MLNALTIKSIAILSYMFIPFLLIQLTCNIAQAPNFGSAQYSISIISYNYLPGELVLKEKLSDSVLKSADVMSKGILMHHFEKNNARFWKMQILGNTMSNLIIHKLKSLYDTFICRCEFVIHNKFNTVNGKCTYNTCAFSEWIE